MKKQAGFTLIEIAIVLVIIGLLLGGVLKGQEMMTNAKIKRTSNDYNGMSAAIFSYLDRYSAFPGDDPNAGVRWGATPGNGDGVIQGTCYSATATDESVQLWDHLRLSGLVAGTGSNFPTHAFGGRIGVEDNSAGLTGTVICMESLQGKIGEILDRQMDDGNGNTGEVRATANAATYTQNTSYTIVRQL